MGRISLIPAVYLVLERDGKYLLMRRMNTGYQDGNYQTPAGHVEERETPREAAAREAKEEVGIDIDLTDLEFVHAAFRMREDKTGYRMDIFFRATTWKGEVRNAEEDKCDDLIWVTPSSLPENTVPFVREVLEGIGRGVMFSEPIV